LTIVLWRFRRLNYAIGVEERHSEDSAFVRQRRRAGIPPIKVSSNLSGAAIVFLPALRSDACDREVGWQGGRPHRRFRFEQEAFMIRTIAALGLCLFAFTASAETMTLASHYKATGTNPDGSAYSGDVKIDVISDTTFSIVWTIAGRKYQGFGMRLNDDLAATYEINGEPGLVIYRLDGDGLNGLWAIRGHNGNGTERLAPEN
jgi:hypothetical protein